MSAFCSANAFNHFLISSSVLTFAGMSLAYILQMSKSRLQHGLKMGEASVMFLSNKAMKTAQRSNFLKENEPLSGTFPAGFFTFWA